MKLKFETIKRENNEPIKVKEFLNKNCVICLDQIVSSDDTARQLIDGPEYPEFDYKDDAHTKPDLLEDEPGPLKESILIPTDQVGMDQERESNIRITKLGTFKSDTPVILHCGHSFHAKCLKNWLKKNQTCPICRANFFIEQKRFVQQRNVEITHTSNVTNGNTNDVLEFFDVLWIVLRGVGQIIRIAGAITDNSSSGSSRGGGTTGGW